MSGTNICLSKPPNLLFKQVGYLMCVTHQIACSACCQNEPPGGRFRCRSAASKSERPPQNSPTPIKSHGKDHRRIWPVPGYSGPVDCRTFEPNPRATVFPCQQAAGVPDPRHRDSGNRVAERTKIASGGNKKQKINISTQLYVGRRRWMD